MSIQNSLLGLKVTSVGSLPRFLIMFIGVVVAPLVFFVIGVYNPNILGQPSRAWSFLAIALLLLISIGSGFLMFRHKSDAAKDLSISPNTAERGGHERENQSL